jgi:hypothetical protein
MVLGVRLEMLRQLIDAGGQQRDLYFRRPGIAGTPLKVLDDLLRGFGIQ